MIHSRQWLVGIALIETMIGATRGFADGVPSVAVTGDQVVIKREASHVIDSRKYRIPLSIEAFQTVTMVAPFDATVKQVILKTNSKTQAQGEIVRLDNTFQSLHLNRAQLALKLAMLELKKADKEETATALAQAKIDLAKVDVEIAQSVLDQTSIRAPFAGEIQRVLVTDGQFVRAGDPIAVVADSSKMKVEIPVDRAAAENGKTVSIKIEANDVDGKVEAVLPLPSKFDGVRELFDSVASVLLVIDNGDGKLKVGQTVYVPLIPRQPVVEVPVSAVGNLADGHRKVQVVRQLIVRDIPVSILGQVGASRVFVSGPFAEGDEVIYESSHQLGDAFVLKAVSGAALPNAATGTAQPGSSQPAAGGTKPQSGF